MIDIEERLTQHFSQRAVRATPRPDLAGVTAAPTVVTLQRVAPRRLRARLAVALAAVAVVLVAGALVVAGQRSTTPASGDLGGWGSDDATCVVFMHPEASEQQIITAGDALRRRPEVVDVRLVTQEEAFAEFRHLFAEKPDIVDIATADILPASWRFGLDPDTEAVRASIDDELTREAMVKNVSCRSASEVDETRGPRYTGPPSTMGAPAMSMGGAAVPPR